MSSYIDKRIIRMLKSKVRKLQRDRSKWIRRYNELYESAKSLVDTAKEAGFRL